MTTVIGRGSEIYNIGSSTVAVEPQHPGNPILLTPHIGFCAVPNLDSGIIHHSFGMVIGNDGRAHGTTTANICAINGHHRIAGGRNGRSKPHKVIATVSLQVDNGGINGILAAASNIDTVKVVILAGDFYIFGRGSRDLAGKQGAIRTLFRNQHIVLYVGSSAHLEPGHITMVLQGDGNISCDVHHHMASIGTRLR